MSLGSNTSSIDMTNGMAYTRRLGMIRPNRSAWHVAARLDHQPAQLEQWATPYSASLRIIDISLDVKKNQVELLRTSVFTSGENHGREPLADGSITELVGDG